MNQDRDSIRFHCENKKGGELNDGTDFPYQQGGEFNGIIAYLTKESGGNVHVKEIVNITASTDAHNSRWRIMDHSLSGFMSQNRPDSWICFDFKGKLVSLSHYTLRSHAGGMMCPIQWEVEGSTDGDHWRSVDSRTTRDLWGRSMVRTYACSKADSSQFFRFIRVKQTGENNNNGHHLCLGGIEFFGKMKSETRI
jgi:hypothetical protein